MLFMWPVTYVKLDIYQESLGLRSIWADFILTWGFPAIRFAEVW